MDHEQPHKWSWHHTLTQNLKAQVYKSSPDLYAVILLVRDGNQVKPSTLIRIDVQLREVNRGNLYQWTMSNHASELDTTL